MLAEDVKLELVNRLRLDGKEKIAPYFSRYAEAAHWRYAPGVIEGRPAMLVFDEADMGQPTHFVLLTWHDGRITGIRDFLFAPYVLDTVEWVQIGQDAV